jgi:protein ImuB
LLAAAFSISPQVEDTAAGVCTIKVDGVAVERRAAVLGAAVTQLRELGLAATAGLASTPLLALYAARFGERAGADAGETSDMGGTPMPRGTGVPPVGLDECASPAFQLEEENAPYLAGGARVVQICAGEERRFLGELPLAVAEPPGETAAILDGWGVRTLGELTALSKADVTQRLGPVGLALWERAAGEVTRPLRLIAPPQTFTAEMALEHEVETLEPLLFLLRRFIDRLALELRNAGYVAGELTLDLMLADETTHTRDFRLPEPTAQEEILFRVLHTYLETLHTEACVRGLRLACRPTRSLVRQHGLFDSALRDPHGFSETLGRVAAIVGADRVGTPLVENSHRADAVTLVVPAAVVPPAAKAGVHPASGLPLRRYRAPLAATVELSGAAPAFVWTAAMQGAVSALAGPWRGSGEWWEAGRGWQREEWDVELETGGLFRLLHTREGWFVEGEYD